MDNIIDSNDNDNGNADKDNTIIINQPLKQHHLTSFKFQKVLSYNLSSPKIYLLGSILSQPAIIHLQKPAFEIDTVHQIFSTSQDDKEDNTSILSVENDGKRGVEDLKVENIGNNDIYKWAHIWLSSNRPPDLRIDVICPCTEVHIKKYSTQRQRMITETPEMYQRIVKPYIDSFPKSRTQWVRNILSGEAEVERVAYSDPDPVEGFVIMPDLKWDLKTVSTLYLSAISRDESIKSLRDLTPRHLPMLRRIRDQSNKLSEGKYGVPKGGVRVYVHYQPSYYHFHIHVISIELDSFPGVAAGRARLLEDVISLLELSTDDENGILQRMTLTYPLGEEHGLYEALVKAQGEKDQRACVMMQTI